MTIQRSGLTCFWQVTIYLLVTCLEQATELECRHEDESSIAGVVRLRRRRVARRGLRGDGRRPRGWRARRREAPRTGLSEAGEPMAAARRPGARAAADGPVRQ